MQNFDEVKYNYRIMIKFCQKEIEPTGTHSVRFSNISLLYPIKNKN